MAQLDAGQDLRHPPTSCALSGYAAMRAAEGPASEVHMCMPLILPKEAEAARLDREQTDGQGAPDATQAVAVTAAEHMQGVRV